MDSGILMIQDSILVCSPDPRIPHTALKRINTAHNHYSCYTELPFVGGECCLDVAISVLVIVVCFWSLVVWGVMVAEILLVAGDGGAFNVFCI
jgi:hypothetical protein